MPSFDGLRALRFRRVIDTVFAFLSLQTSVETADFDHGPHASEFRQTPLAAFRGHNQTTYLQIACGSARAGFVRLNFASAQSR